MSINEPTPHRTCDYCGQRIGMHSRIAELEATLSEWEACGDRIMAAIGASGPLSDSDVIGEIETLREFLHEVRP